MKQLVRKYKSNDRVYVVDTTVSFGVTNDDFLSVLSDDVHFYGVNIADGSRFPLTMSGIITLNRCLFPEHWTPPTTVSSWWNVPYSTFKKFKLPQKVINGVNLCGVDIGEHHIDTICAVDTPSIQVYYNPKHTCFLAEAKAKMIRVFWGPTASNGTTLFDTSKDDVFSFQEKLLKHFETDRLGIFT